MARRVLSAAMAAALMLSAPLASAEECGAMPCRANGAPYITDKGALIIFPGEHFAVEFSSGDGQLQLVQAKPISDATAALMELKFSATDSGMILTVMNPLSQDIKYDAVMKAPDDKLVYTSSCPVRAGLSTFESWPHAIKFLALSNFRLLKEGDDTACQ